MTRRRLSNSILTLALALLGLASAARGGLTIDPGERFAEATKALESGDPEGAIQIFETLLADEWHSAELYHNLGVAYQRQGKPRRALLQLYRAWLLDPFSKAARADFLSLTEEANFSKSRINQAERQVSALAWRRPLAIIGMAAFWLGLFAILAFRLPLARGLGAASIAIGVLTSIGAYWAHCWAPSQNAGWIIHEEPVPLRATHGEGAPSMGSLSPLTSVKTTAQRENWSYVNTHNQQRSGWVDAKHIGALMPWRS